MKNLFLVGFTVGPLVAIGSHFLAPAVSPSIAGLILSGGLVSMVWSLMCLACIPSSELMASDHSLAQSTEAGQATMTIPQKAIVLVVLPVFVTWGTWSLANSIGVFEFFFGSR